MKPRTRFIASVIAESTRPGIRLPWEPATVPAASAKPPVAPLPVRAGA